MLLLLLMLLLRRLKLVVVVVGDAEALLVGRNVFAVAVAVAVVDEQLWVLVWNVEIHPNRQKRVALSG